MSQAPPIVVERYVGGKMQKQYFIGYVNPDLNPRDVPHNLVSAKFGQEAQLLRTYNGRVLSLDDLVAESCLEGVKYWRDQRAKGGIHLLIAQAIVQAAGRLPDSASSTGGASRILHSSMLSPEAQEMSPPTTFTKEDTESLANGPMSDLIISGEDGRPDGRATVHAMLAMFSSDVEGVTGIRSTRTFTVNMFSEIAALFGMRNS